MSKKVSKNEAIKAYKVFEENWQCKGFQFEVGKTFEHTGRVEICSSGFHACKQVEHCFSYYDFDSSNKVAEVLMWGDIDEKGDDSKICGSHIEIIREIEWAEVLVLANHGKDNTGHSNTGDRNTGDSNTGDRNTGDSNTGDSNTGDSNTGDSNTGDSNTGDSNTGDRNTGDSNTGSWNTGDSNTGDSNTGYRNTGAFCTDPNPEVWLFDKPSGILVRDWEQHRAVQIMNSLEIAFWIPSWNMTDKEKKANPSWETAEGYLKNITMHEAWANLWPNLDNASRQVFLDLPNFDAKKFEEITGIKIKKGKK